MQVGDIVAVQWVDSGMGWSGGDLADVLAAALARPTTYGEVMHLDAEHLVIAQELDEEGAFGDFCKVWVPAIVSSQVLREFHVAPEPKGGGETDVLPLMPVERRVKCSCHGCSSGEKWCASSW